MYMAIKYGNVMAIEETLPSLAESLPIPIIVKNGIVTVNGKQDTVSYNVEEYTDEEAYRDFCNSRMARIIGNLGIKLYRTERLY